RPVSDKQRCNNLVVLEGVGGKLDDDAQAIAAPVPFIGQAKDACPLGSSCHIGSGRENSAEFHIRLVNLGCAPDYLRLVVLDQGCRHAPAIRHDSYWAI